MNLMADDWKQKYFAALADAERDEQELQRMAVLLRLTASRLAAPAAGLDPQLDQQLDQLLAGVRTSPVSASVEALLDDISSSVSALDRNTSQLDEALQSSGSGPSARPSPESRFLAMLDAVDHEILDPQALEATRAALKESVPDSRWPATVRQIAELITEAAARQSREVRELKGFLHRLTSRLKEIDRSLAGTQDQFAENLKRGEAMAESVNSDLGLLSSDVAQATDLPELRELVELRTEAIHSRLQGFIDHERERHVAQDEELNALRRRVGELESSAGELKSELADARQAATVDALTGLLNRGAYDAWMDELIEESRHANAPLGLVVCDIDHFKKLNDTLGHHAGDKVLESVARVLAKSVRRDDLVARYGGEEFVVVLPGSSGAHARQAAEKIRAAIEAANFRFQGEKVAVTISCGCAELSGTESALALFERADQLLYQAKATGRNRVCGPGAGAGATQPLSRAG
ncbi:MAG: diguanylate cyclase [Pseudomonadota bacterium]